MLKLMHDDKILKEYEDSAIFLIFNDNIAELIGSKEFINTSEYWPFVPQEDTSAEELEKVREEERGEVEWKEEEKEEDVKKTVSEVQEKAEEQIAKSEELIKEIEKWRGKNG